MNHSYMDFFPLLSKLARKTHMHPWTRGEGQRQCASGRCHRVLSYLYVWLISALWPFSCQFQDVGLLSYEELLLGPPNLRHDGYKRNQLKMVGLATWSPVSPEVNPPLQDCITCQKLFFKC